jgi:hypothetical protein
LYSSGKSDDKSVESMGRLSITKHFEFHHFHLETRRQTTMWSKLNGMALAAALATVLFGTVASGEVVLPNLPAGSQYQLIFVTSGKRDATSTDINDYNMFVSQQAADNSTAQG